MNLLRLLGLMGRRRVLQMSSRLVTELTHKADRVPLSASLRRLVEGGYLTVVKESTFLTGRVYGRGRSLRGDSTSGRNIRQLAGTLFGKDGLCQELSGNPVFGHGFLNLSGLPVMGVLTHANGPISRVELRRYLSPVMQPETTARVIKRLYDLGLIDNKKKIVLVDNWAERLEHVGKGRPAERSTRTKALHEIHRNHYRLARGLPTAADRRELLKFPCVICERPAVEIEHFPPQIFLKAAGLAKHRSRLRAHYSFLHPICTSCHDEHDSWITAHAKSALPVVKPSRITWVGDPDVDKRKRVLTDAMTRWAKLYYRALEKDRSDRALLAIAHALACWRGWTAGDHPLLEPTGVVLRPPKRMVRGTKGAGSRRLRRRSRRR
jgi:hypothetical protein